MIQLIRLAPAFFMVLALSVLVSCASTPTQEGSARYIDDSILTTKVNAVIMGDLTLSSVQISAETFKSEVQLGGFVISNADISKEVAVAKDVIGVKSVRNEM